MYGGDAHRRVHPVGRKPRVDRVQRVHLGHDGLGDLVVLDLPLEVADPVVRERAREDCARHDDPAAGVDHGDAGGRGRPGLDARERPVFDDERGVLDRAVADGEDVGAGDGEGPVVGADSVDERRERARHTGIIGLQDAGALVFQPSVHEHPLDPVGGEVQEVPVEEDQVRVLAGLDAPDAVVEHHGAGAVDRHDFQRLLVGETVPRQERPVLAEVLEVLL